MRQVSNEYLTISSSICMRAQKGHLKSIHLSVYEVIQRARREIYHDRIKRWRCGLRGYILESILTSIQKLLIVFDVRHFDGA